ncbi:hypothetical protein [Sphingopyxis sp. MG]|uniref:hypothetical protein n=1 Tax=Sphingopyxis sp. MG TaxID=1866325 RepID=UPI000CDF425E|nr:hypothetical protein [Sphingopyxis sp. MG]AVA13651.1 hypothetical protein C3E99_07185 [Sphingopyxis sp. MG]
MTAKKEEAIRAVRDRLRSELAELDRLGERMAAIELNSAIELLTERLGEVTSETDIQKLQNRFFGN